MNNDKNIELISKRLGLHRWQVENCIRLMEGGATIPFISRYRKEMTGSLDEVTISSIKDENNRLKELDARIESVKKSIEEQGKMTPELLLKIESAPTMSELEDIYLPYRPKRRTRSTIAKEKGLEPLAEIIFKQGETDPEIRAEQFLNEDVADIAEAVSGARDIIAEWISEDKTARTRLRNLYDKEAVIYSRVIKGKEIDGSKFSDYFDWSEPLKKCPSHRLLAMRRGEEEGFLRLSIKLEDENALAILKSVFIRSANKSSEIVDEAVSDSWK
jgi:uncharacterized protein